MTPTEGHGQRPRTPAHEEADPTGIRDLLRALPDPEPMPEDLVTRISARLSEEQTLRARADVVDLAAERSRRRPGRTVAYLGVAAAGLLVATVAVGELGGSGILGGTTARDSAAQVSTRSEGSDAAGPAEAGSQDAAGAAGADAGAEAGAGGDGGGGAEADTGAGGADAAESGGAAADQPRAASAGTVDVLTPLGEVTLASYRDEGLEAVAAHGGSDTAMRAEQTGLDQRGADNCWQAGSDRQDWPRRHAAEAVLDGEPVVVLIGLEDDDRGVAVLLPRSCTTGAPVEVLDTVTWGS